ncbi:MAG TPA: PDZ domain-containing protein [Gemmatales bacterium]|nr:PDZ domain-containing protein [Gemmatales bacterium]
MASCWLPLALLLTGLQGTAGDEPRPASPEPVTVPFELLASRHMAVTIVVNGKGPYRMIFDTGAPVNLLSTKIGREAQVTPERPARRPGAPRGGALMPMGVQLKVKDLEMGELMARDVPVMVFDHPTIKAIGAVLGPIEGIIGFPLFSRYRVTIDYQKKEMTFVPVDYDPGDVMAVLMQSVMGSRRDTQPRPLASPVVLGARIEEKDGQLIVAGVFGGSAAETAGLRAGDQLLELDGHWLTDLVDLSRALGHQKAGQSTQLKIQRGEEEKELSLQVRLGL